MPRILKDYPSVSLKVEDLEHKIDFVRIFGRLGPVHIEIGAGKATFLVNQARARPDINFLGIERAGKYYRYAVDRIGRWGLTNVRVIRTEAAYFLAEFVPNDSVDCFHIYFPDPWPKKRHHKRRFLNPANLDNLLRALSPGGTIRIATDHPDYFAVAADLLGKNADRLEPTQFLPAAGADLGEWVGTNFERKYLKANRQIYTMAAKKLR
jgi:tRNA (guanine-N7-)-methyltransferase